MYFRSHDQEVHETNPVGIDYLVRNIRKQQDHTHKVPNKKLEKERLPWGFHGYTYLQDSKMWINELLDYTPDLKFETEIHEAIHTDDEYETRIISKDMVKIESRESIIRKIMENYQSKNYKNFIYS